MSDLSLQRAVMQALADNRYVHADLIAAQVVDGRVTLHGTVGRPIERGEAIASVLAVPGVVDFADQLFVRPLGVDGRVDADTAAAVMDALFADEELHSAQLDVQVREGTATLRGVVERPHQIGRAEHIAREVPGVSAVTNRLDALLTADAG
jgi:osmotically-inducible protein OsmY